MSFFFFLPSILLSGFMFPFRGMPHWAQMIGEVFPLTHFLRIVRGILLKGNGLEEIAPELWPIAPSRRCAGDRREALPADAGLTHETEANEASPSPRLLTHPKVKEAIDKAGVAGA